MESKKCVFYICLYAANSYSLVVFVHLIFSVFALRAAALFSCKVAAQAAFVAHRTDFPLHQAGTAGAVKESQGLRH